MTSECKRVSFPHRPEHLVRRQDRNLKRFQVRRANWDGGPSEKARLGSKEIGGGHDHCPHPDWLSGRRPSPGT